MERVQRQPEQTIIATSIVITEEFIPSFRMVAYYVVPGAQKEVVSDSVSVDTANSCIKQVRLAVKEMYGGYVYIIFINYSLEKAWIDAYGLDVTDDV